MRVKGKQILVLGGGGMVGVATCQKLLDHKPDRLTVAARREAKARGTAEALQAEFPDMKSRIQPVWGDIFMRAEWQDGHADDRAAALADKAIRRQLISDVLAPLDDEILDGSLLAEMILGSAPGCSGIPADIVIDCMNTATAVSYQDIYSLANRLFDMSDDEKAKADWGVELELVLAALSVPQLVRHVQILYEAMRRANTQAYIKVGTSGTGGMGFNIPYTHGEERPSRLLLSKASLAGAQTALTFLMARTPDAPPMVREIKPAAAIGWREIDYGPIERVGRAFPLYDCPPSEAVSIADADNLVRAGAFGTKTGEQLKGVFIDTGENGVFSADEFTAITGLGQMQFVTPEDVARNVIEELTGGTTGRDIVGALDGSITGPSYRGGVLRQNALTYLRELEAKHGASIAFEIVGPPRMSKLLFEGHLIQRLAGGVQGVINANIDELAAELLERISQDAALRQHIISIGLGILLPDGEHLLRGPLIKADTAHHGWVDLTPDNIAIWQARFAGYHDAVADDRQTGTSSHSTWRQTNVTNRSDGAQEFDIGELVGWLFTTEEGGGRTKD